MISIPETDTDFEEVIVDRVEKYSDGSGWAIGHGSVWFGAVPADSPITPSPRMTARFYGGASLGSRVRGLMLDGVPVFYRTVAEDDEHQDIMLYGADCADLLARWDRGEAIHTIEMGGMGPGYEQALQITMIEILRHLTDQKPDPSMWQHKEEWATARERISKAVSPRLAYLGLSGAQWGAALNLATALYCRGPRETMHEPQFKERHIMVSRDFPQPPPVAEQAR